LWPGTWKRSVSRVAKLASASRYGVAPCGDEVVAVRDRDRFLPVGGRAGFSVLRWAEDLMAYVSAARRGALIQ
jgi:hypothetical protein